MSFRMAQPSISTAIQLERHSPQSCPYDSEAIIAEVERVAVIIRDGSDKHQVFRHSKSCRDCLNESGSESPMEGDQVEIDRYIRKCLIHQLGIGYQLRPKEGNERRSCYTYAGGLRYILDQIIRMDEGQRGWYFHYCAHIVTLRPWRISAQQTSVDEA